MIKKTNIIAVTFAILTLATGCSAKAGIMNSATTDSVAEISTSVSETEAPSTNSVIESGEMEKGESTIIGTISDIKDFMFVITDDKGQEFVLSFDDQKPEGLNSVTDGDLVAVVYTGLLEKTEAFTGTVISVTKR